MVLIIGNDEATAVKLGSDNAKVYSKIEKIYPTA